MLIAFRSIMAHAWPKLRGGEPITLPWGFHMGMASYPARWAGLRNRDPSGLIVRSSGQHHILPCEWSLTERILSRPFRALIVGGGFVPSPLGWAEESRPFGPHRVASVSLNFLTPLWIA